MKKKLRVALNLIHHKYNRNKNAQKIKMKRCFNSRSLSFAAVCKFISGFHFRLFIFSESRSLTLLIDTFPHCSSTSPTRVWLIRAHEAFAVYKKFDRNHVVDLHLMSFSSQQLFSDESSNKTNVDFNRFMTWKKTTEWSFNDRSLVDYLWLFYYPSSSSYLPSRRRVDGHREPFSCWFGSCRKNISFVWLITDCDGKMEVKKDVLEQNKKIPWLNENPSMWDQVASYVASYKSSKEINSTW